MPFSYGDLQAEMDMINRAYIDVMTAGDAKGPGVHVPDPDLQHHARLSVGQRQRAAPVHNDREIRPAVLSENFLNSEMKPNMIRSVCCRLQLDLRELLKRGNGSISARPSRRVRWAWSRSTSRAWVTCIAMMRPACWTGSTNCCTSRA